MALTTVQTEDGSPTCFEKEVGEHYHNRAGAYTEALLTHVEPSGVLAVAQTKKKIAALDVPYGMGYNSLVLIQELIRYESRPEKVEIIGIELDREIVQLIPEVLNYPRFNLLKEALGPDLNRLVESFTLFRPGEVTVGGMVVHMKMLNADMREAVPGLLQEKIEFDAIWHDPFSPNKMPELWTTDMFKVYRGMLGESGRLSTYSVAVTVRGGMREAGFHLYRSTAVGVKSGGTIGCANKLEFLPAGIEQLSDEEEERLARKTVVPYRDEQFQSTRAETRKRRDLELDSIKKSLAQS